MCLDENDLATYIAAPRGSAFRGWVEAHVDVCVYCRALLANFLGTWEPQSTDADDTLVDSAPGAHPDDATTAVARSTAPKGYHWPEGGAGHAALKPGDILDGRFELDRVVGRGGTSVVWAAFDRTRNGFPVALKVLAVREAALRHRVAREARIANGIAHPAVVPVREVFEIPSTGAIVLVTDLLRGRTLASHLRAMRTLSLEAARDIFLPLMDGVLAAHRLGVVHRDLKPANVFLADDGRGGFHVKVLDFGTAKLTAAEGIVAMTSSLTRSGMLLGTIPYMAVEQLEGKTDIDARTDVWALGVMLYEALCGERPIPGRSFVEILQGVSMGPIVPIGLRMPHLPAHIARLVDAMLTRDRATRPDRLEPLMVELRRG